MNDFSYIENLSDAAIQQQIGEFIKTRRLDLNLSQDEVAKRAAISRSTLSLAERGENIALNNLLKILRVLDALYVFNSFKVVRQISPILLAREEESKRKHAYRSSTGKASDPRSKNGTSNADNASNANDASGASGADHHSSDNNSLSW